MLIQKLTHIVLSAPVPVYDLSVPGTENFLLEAGVFVHNSKDCADAVCGAYTNMLERRSTWLAASSDDVLYEEANRASFDERFEEERRV